VRSNLSRAVDAVLGSSTLQPVAVKVPQITVLFWLIKVTSTAMGEALADWLDGSPDVVVAGLGTLLALGAFVAALRLQFRTRRYVTAVYWFTVAMVATFGTMAADALHQFTGAPYWSTTLFYALVLGLVFWRWWVNEATLSIHSIDSRRREKFYWGTVLATFALGTATGDWTASELNLGFASSLLLFAVAICLPALAYALRANPIVTFWVAYVLTRPLGASFADWTDYPRSGGGLGVDHVIVWGGLGLVMTTLVTLLAARERDLADAAAPPVAEPAAGPALRNP
jgi:uncharacterized membrane-anchored protein